jgi:hypothetical protein
MMVNGASADELGAAAQLRRCRERIVDPLLG